MTVLLSSSPLVHRALPATRARWAMHWPLTVMILGFPIWWLLGLRTVVPLLAAAVMADQLTRRRRIAIPRGFGIWLLFLGWVCLGVFVLWADAPFAVPGGGPSRAVVFGYRLCWYLACTVALLWIGNASEREVSSRRVRQLLGYMFVVTAAGGLLGVIAPLLQLTSVLEMVLPHGIATNSFVHSIVHPGVADVQNVLGRPEARPKAPFAYANSWGSNFALLLPFFLVAWFRDGPRWQRWAGPVVLALAAIPVIYSLNRGLWVCLAIGAVGLLALQIRNGNMRLLGVATGGLLIAGLLFVLSPLGEIFTERLAHQHSNERRGQLLDQTFGSALHGSPIVGFGSTRDVQGSFASIAGASTPDCGACGVPPLGTQGHLWLVIFSQGLIGTLIFLGFLAVALSMCWRARTVTEALALCLLVFLAVQLFVYDTLGLPLFWVMLAVGLVWREQRNSEPLEVMGTLHRMVGRWRRALPLTVALVVLGGAIGAGIGLRQPQMLSTKVSILLAASPVYLATGVLDSSSPPRDATIDTEAALVLSRQSLARVAGTSDPDTLEALRANTRVTAIPNTQVLQIEARAGTGEASRRRAQALAQSYLATRRDYLSDRRDQVLGLLQEQLLEFSAQNGAPSGQFQSADDRAAALTQDRLRQLASDLLFTETSAGEVIRPGEPRTVRRQLEVPVTSGVALGLGASALVLTVFPALFTRRRKETA